MKAIWKICAAVMALCMLAVAIMSATMGYCGGVLECGTSSVPMHCYYAYQTTIGVGIAGAIMGVAGLLMKSSDSRRMCALAVIVLAVLALAVLFVLVGVCSNSSMSCNVNRIPISVVCVVAVAAAIVGMVRADDAQASRPKAKL